ncbi:hypothetical protein [uncultured Aquimarina sp.]|uniref:hypothetical protein n=1 Tax=uncultured Aquimarina sp. TaxID=575652 RepID=UPI00260C22E7|nr:hypothetical protein [uncultured Aquimarina sp.]
MLLFIGYQSLAQETFRPFIDQYGDNLVWDNFPAISEDGSHYLIIYNEYSCCIDLGFTLKKIHSKDGKVLSEINLSPSEEAPDFMVEKQKTIYRNVKQLLASNDYQTLKEVGGFKQISDDSIYLEIGIENQVYKSEKFIISQLPSNGFCCNGGTDIKEDCLLDQTIINVSLSIKHHMLLIVTGLAQVADGCDQGPFYQMIPIAKE